MAKLSLRNSRAWLIFITDFIGVALILWLTAPQLQRSLVEFTLVIIAFLFSLFAAGTYAEDLDIGSPRLPIRTLITCLFTASLLIIFYTLAEKNFTLSLAATKQNLINTAILLGLISTLDRYTLNKLYRVGKERKKLLYLGYSRAATEFFKDVSISHKAPKINVVASCPSFINNGAASKFDETPNAALDFKWHGVILDPSFEPEPALQSKLISLSISGTNFWSLNDYYETSLFMLNLENIGEYRFPSNQIAVTGNAFPLINVKRIIDISLSVLLIIVTSPILIFFASLLKLTSLSPIIFKQQRVGENGKLFNIYKLRTMIENAEASGPQWATENDKRITKIGKFLRNTKIDELPQCINILKGDMSLIGPRPERPEFTSKLAQSVPHYELRHTVKPGLTGWAQVNYKYGSSTEDALRKLKYDLFYIKNYSLLLDLNILLRTVLVVIDYRN